MILLFLSLVIFIAVWIAVLDDNKKHRAIALAVFLIAMSFHIAIVSRVSTITSACEADLTYGEKCVLQAIPVYQLED
jgi:uncharacterized BrkB/YihY/UPF0761 family membrane protein